MIKNEKSGENYRTKSPERSLKRSFRGRAGTFLYFREYAAGNLAKRNDDSRAEVAGVPSAVAQIAELIVAPSAAAAAANVIGVGGGGGEGGDELAVFVVYRSQKAGQSGAAGAGVYDDNTADITAQVVDQRVVFAAVTVTGHKL